MLTIVTLYLAAWNLAHPDEQYFYWTEDRKYETGPIVAVSREEWHRRNDLAEGYTR